MKREMRILFFIGNLAVGGKERRLIELLTFLKEQNNFQLLVVVTENIISFDTFSKLGLSFVCINKKWKKYDPTVFYQFYKLCSKFKPDIIHTWGRVQSFYTLPTVVLQKISLVNGQITSAPPKLAIKLSDRLIDSINFRFSKVVLSNSLAGIVALNSPLNKSKVIYNGINLCRFEDLPSIETIKNKYQICTPLVVIMVASFSSHKNYDLFYSIARKVIELRDDVTFIGVGGTGFKNSSYERLSEMYRNIPRIIVLKEIQEVEAMVNACDIGILFSNIANHGEGISNSIMEYMALSKPVIANDAGGTKEIVIHGENGYLIQEQDEEEICGLLMELLNNKEKRLAFGKAGREKLEKDFSLKGMGEAFIEIYHGFNNDVSAFND